MRTFQNAKMPRPKPYDKRFFKPDGSKYGFPGPYGDEFAGQANLPTGRHIPFPGAQFRPGIGLTGGLLCWMRMTTKTVSQNRTWPRQFLKDFEQTGTALWFYLYLLTWMNPKTGYVRTTFARASREIGVSSVALKAWLEQLEGEGYLRDESLDSKMVVAILLFSRQ